MGSASGQFLAYRLPFACPPLAFRAHGNGSRIRGLGWIKNEGSLMVKKADIGSKRLQLNLDTGGSLAFR
ncbi:MAG: hypothetical protein ACFCU9_05750 [Cyanophyceae cyanobacterium]